MIKEDEFCPADILIIETSDPKGTLISESCLIYKDYATLRLRTLTERQI